MAQDPGGPSNYYPYLEKDGSLGVVTKEYFQRYLQHKGWYPADYLIDGVFGPGTVKAWQKMLKHYGRYSGLIDGDFGNMTKSALSIWLSEGRNDGYKPCQYVAGSWACVVPSGSFWNHRNVYSLQLKLNALSHYGRDYRPCTHRPTHPR